MGQSDTSSWSRFLENCSIRCKKIYSIEEEAQAQVISKVRSNDKKLNNSLVKVAKSIEDTTSTISYNEEGFEVTRLVNVSSLSDDCRMEPTPIKQTVSDSGLKIVKLRHLSLSDGDNSIASFDDSPLSFGSKSLVDDF